MNGHPASIAQRKLARFEITSDGDTIIEYEALAPPTRVGLRNGLEVVEDTASQVVDLVKAALFQVRSGFLTPDPAGAEHRDLCMLCGIKLGVYKGWELTEARGLGVHRGSAIRRVERSNLVLELVTRIDDKDIVTVDQSVPVLWFDVCSRLPAWVNTRHAHGHDLTPKPDLRSIERLFPDSTQCGSKVGEQTAEDRVRFQEVDQRQDAFGRPGNCSIDTFRSKDHGAFDRMTRHKSQDWITKPFVCFSALTQRREAVHRGDQKFRRRVMRTCWLIIVSTLCVTVWIHARATNPVKGIALR